MPQGDKAKEECFRLWTQGKSVTEIQSATNAEYDLILDWVRQWERGAQGKWEVVIKR
jgi:hypothetical protein